MVQTVHVLYRTQFFIQELEKERRRMKEVAERAKAEKEKLLAPVANEG